MTLKQKRCRALLRFMAMLERASRDSNMSIEEFHSMYNFGMDNFLC